MQTRTHDVDFCVAGGGLAGICAAIAAARHGIRVALMQDRPVLGGNCSSEIRMWVCGAQGRDRRETGLVHEISQENRYRNPNHNYSIWDSVLYEKVRFEPNITLLLNCSCCRAFMDGSRIRTVSGWQLTTETWHTVRAPLFADCSGDGILAPLTGADIRIGRESGDEFGESLGQDAADRQTMGLSCLIQARETGRPQPFIPPKWAYRFPADEDLPNRDHDVRTTNFWWIELGGDRDSIHDTEEIRDELLRVAFGVWDHIKNHGDHDADNWTLDWVGFLPGKRESRRYVGDHLLTQNDVQAEGRFDDIVAYHGWGLDDHHPAGFHYRGKPNIHPPCPSPSGIPLRCLYSRNVANLMMAGRNISATHVALSSTRVMATCALLGQAVGTTAAVARHHDLSPRQACCHRIRDIQNLLMDDDCWIPWHRRPIPALSRDAQLSATSGDPEPLRNGIDRPFDGDDNGWTGALGSCVTYRFSDVRPVRELRFVFDSDLNQLIDGRNILSLASQHAANLPGLKPAGSLVRAFRVEAETPDGHWMPLHRETNNYQRLVRVAVNTKARAVRFIPETTRGAAACHMFAWDVR